MLHKKETKTYIPPVSGVPGGDGRAVYWVFHVPGSRWRRYAPGVMLQ